MREGLAGLLAKEPGIAIAGSAGTAQELRTLVQIGDADALVMDLMLHDADGLSLIKEISSLSPRLRIVVFSLHPEDVYAERCLRAGAHGYVMKTEPVATLFAAIRVVAAGGVALSPRMMNTVVSGITGHVARQGSEHTVLTDRELQVFRLTGMALPTRAVAEKLGVSVKTIEAHRENIKNKLRVDTHAALVARAAQWVQASGGSG